MEYGYGLFYSRWFQYMTNFNQHLIKSVIVALLLSGCTRIGPEMMYKDRFDYTKAVGDSWKEQVLLNIVRLRYSDWPTFVTVDQISHSLHNGAYRDR